MVIIEGTGWSRSRRYPLLALAFQLHLCKLNLVCWAQDGDGRSGDQVDARRGEGHDQDGKAADGSIMAKKHEQHKEELKKQQMKKRLKKKNAKMLRRKDAEHGGQGRRKGQGDRGQAGQLRAQNELVRLLDNIQFHSKCFRQFTPEELQTIGSVMSMQPYKKGEAIIPRGPSPPLWCSSSRVGEH